MFTDFIHNLVKLIERFLIQLSFRSGSVCITAGKNGVWLQSLSKNCKKKLEIMWKIYFSEQNISRPRILDLQSLLSYTLCEINVKVGSSPQTIYFCILCVHFLGAIQDTLEYMSSPEC